MNKEELRKAILGCILENSSNGVSAMADSLLEIIPQQISFPMTPQEFADASGCYVAKDEDGKWIYYGAEPSLREHIWSAGSSEYLPIPPALLTNDDIPWQESLCIPKSKQWSPEPIDPDAVYGVWDNFTSDWFVFDTLRLGKNVSGWDCALKYDETTKKYAQMGRKDLPPEILERARRK